MGRFISFIFAIAVFAYLIVSGISFNINCGDYLKRAADANTVELAVKELETALNYIEENDLTDGYTSVIYKSPDEDLGFWYTNIKSAYEELKSIPDNATMMEKSNALMKLRETLLDNGEKGETLTIPSGISVYPNNALMMILTFIACVCLIYTFTFFNEW